MSDQIKIQYDPNIWVSKPFIKCPECECENCYGVLSIHGNSYSRKCVKCGSRAKYGLPKIRKKIIYLDQFVISNMIKSIHPNIASTKSGANNKFYKEMFCKLDKLIKLQLVVCPYSGFHKDESLLSSFPKEHREMYEHLSNGISFKNYMDIISDQLYQVVSLWLEGDNAKYPDLKPNRVMNRDIHVWEERFRLSVNLGLLPNYVEDMTSIREEVGSKVRKIFNEVWKKEKKNKIQWYNEELTGFYDNLIKSYNSRTLQLQKILSGLYPFSLDAVIPDYSQNIICNLKNKFLKYGVLEVNFWKKLKEFFLSQFVCKIPFIQISSWMYAAMACKAKSKKNIKDSFPADVTLISTLLPYCDAMIIDKECHSILNELNKELVDYPCKIFSLNNKYDFFEFLNSIEDDCSTSHFELIDEIYGEGWAGTYTDIYV